MKTKVYNLKYDWTDWVLDGQLFICHEIAQLLGFDKNKPQVLTISNVAFKGSKKIVFGVYRSNWTSIKFGKTVLDGVDRDAYIYPALRRVLTEFGKTDKQNILFFKVE
jgi:hypothetical protein